MSSARAGKRAAMFAGAVTLVAATLMLAMFWKDMQESGFVESRAVAAFEE